MKRWFSLLFSILLALSLTVISFAEKSDTNDSLKTGSKEKVVEQLNALYELGLIENSELKKENNKLTKDNVKILEDSYYLVAIDTKTKKKIEDIDAFIKEERQKRKYKSKEEIQSQDASTMSLLVYVVHFTTGIGNPNTYGAELFKTGEVTDVFGIGTKPKSYTILLKIFAATSRNGSYSIIAGKTETVPEDREVSVTTPITKTYYWKTDGKAFANFETYSEPADDDEDTGPWLLNKKGVEYPEYTDPYSGKELTEPASTTWSKVNNPGCGLTSSERTAYRNWYESTYGVKLDWSQYEIHHIRPCAYGGTNDYNNLIVVPYSFHRQVITPWWSAY